VYEPAAVGREVENRAHLVAKIARLQVLGDTDDFNVVPDVGRIAPADSAAQRRPGSEVRSRDGPAYDDHARLIGEIGWRKPSALQ
jgi:hypothetical protein